MPFYEYECQNPKCGHSETMLQKISGAPLNQCPKCNQSSFQKLISAAGFQLKGSGWYVTDFRDKKSSTTSENKTTSDAKTTE